MYSLNERAARALDVVVSALLLLLSSPLMLALALLVKLSSPGPVFFRQQRVGRQGRLFWLYKFRSMRVAGAGPLITSAGDRRITPVGAVLRKWKLDELPQLFNVLRGDMSLVGPRPEVLRYVQRYTEEQRQVLSVRPGITGLSQLAYHNEEELLAGQEDAEDYYLRVLLPAKLALDLEYIRQRTLRSDLQILWQTLRLLLRRRTGTGR